MSAAAARRDGHFRRVLVPHHAPQTLFETCAELAILQLMGRTGA